MMTVYVICAVLGGLLVLLSLLGHGHGHDGGDLDIGHHDIDLGHHDVGAGGHDFGHVFDWIPILSLRFWSFGLGAFGLTGILLMTVAGLSGQAAMWTSVATGAVCGLAVATTLKIMMKHQASSLASEDDLRGAEGLVTVAIRGKEPGRIRCVVNGDTIDLLAITDEPDFLNPGVHVVIVDIENDRARVISRSALLDSSPLPLQST